MPVLNSDRKLLLKLYGNLNSKQTFTKTKVEKRIKIYIQHTGKKFELDYFEYSISSIKHKLKK